MVYPALAILNRIRRGLVDEAFNEDLSELALKELPKYYQVRFTNLQAAMGIEQLKILDCNNEKRRRNGELLNTLLKDHRKITIPSVISHVESIYLNYVVKVKDRERIMDALFKKGIDVTKGFLIDCSAHQLFKDYQTDSPHAQLLSQQGMYLPVYPSLKDEDIHYIVKALKEVI
jgi:dTDP-4-amino-4,6-dideoxygalactose transaminase